MDTILTVPEVAEYLKISKAKIYYLIQRKEIPHILIGRNVRIRESDLMEWLKSRVVKPVQYSFWPKEIKLLDTVSNSSKKTRALPFHDYGLAP
jgi:excisionase family DNA binding protein